MKNTTQLRIDLRSDRVVLIAAAALALAVPVLAAHCASRRLHGDVEPTLTAALGESVSIGDVEASLTGAVRLTDVAVGGVFRADAIEASVGLDSLLSGHLGADEIRIESPQMRTRVDRTGEQKLRRLVQRAAQARRRATGNRAPAASAPRLRRIVVTGGQLRVDLEGRGALVAHELALHPHATGVRVVAGRVDLDVIDDGIQAAARFERAAADVELPALRLSRALSVGGDVVLTGPRVGTVHWIDTIVSKGVDSPDGVALVARVAGDPQASIEFRAGGGVVEVNGVRMPLAPLAAFAPAWVRLVGAHATGSARFARATDGGIAVTADLTLAGAALSHPKIALEPVALDGRAVLDAHAVRGGDGTALSIDSARFETAGITVTAGGTATLSGGDVAFRRAELALHLPTTPCMSVLRAIPEPARRRLAGLAATGSMKADLDVAFDRADPEATELAIDVDVSRCKVTREADAADPIALLEPFAHAFPDGSTATIGPGRPDYARIDTIPAVVTGAFVAAEDARFWTHAGFDPRQIEASLAVDISQGELLRGGSTITQQLAKNVFLEPDRTFARKLEEAVLAWRLESRLSKREILEVYLNIIELGDGVFGLHDAARYWFDKSVRQLSVREVAFLAALTPAPRTISRRVRATGKVDKATNRRIDIVLRHMKRGSVISPASYARAKAAPLSIRAPRLAAR